MSDNTIVNDLMDVEGELPIKVRKRLYDIAKIVLPCLGIAGILVTALTAHLDADVAAYVSGGFLILSGLLHAIASSYTDPATVHGTNKSPDVAVQSSGYTSPPSTSAPTDTSSAGGTSGSNLGGTPPA